MNRHVSLTLFLVLVLGGGLASGFVAAPGASYAAWVAFAALLNGSIWLLN